MYVEEDWSVAPPPQSELVRLPPPPPPPPAVPPAWPRYIVGPISLTEHYRPARGTVPMQHIYVFGEAHVHQSTCPKELKVHKYLSQVISSNRDKKLDLFVEVPFISRAHAYRPERAAQSYLDLIQETYEACFQLDKQRCPYHDHVQFHYVDMRWSPALEWLTLLWECMLSWPEQHRTSQRQVAHQRRLAALDRAVSTRPYAADDQGQGRDPLHMEPLRLMRQTKLDRQLSRIPDPATRLLVQRYFQPRLRQYLAIMSEYEYNDIRALLDLPFNEMPDDTVAAFWRLMVPIRDLLMDVTDCYTVARMLRLFKDGEVRQHIIYYGGDEHAKTLRDVLSKARFQTVQSAYSNREGLDFQCLDLSSFHQPFFT